MKSVAAGRVFVTLAVVVRVKRASRVWVTPLAALIAVVMLVAVALTIGGCWAYLRANGYAKAWALMGLGGMAGFMLLMFLRPIRDDGPPVELSMNPPTVAPDSTPDSEPESDVAIA